MCRAVHKMHIMNDMPANHPAQVCHTYYIRQCFVKQAPQASSLWPSAQSTVRGHDAVFAGLADILLASAVSIIHALGIHPSDIAT